MTYGHLIDLGVLDQLGEPLISVVPRRLLQVFAVTVSRTLHVERLAVKLQSQTSAERPDELLVFVRFVAAQPVIEVGDGQPDAQFRGEGNQRM